MFIKCLKSLAEESNEDQFNVIVQQQLKIYENICLDPAKLLDDIFSHMALSHRHPVYEKQKRAITFADFQKFCGSFSEEMKIEASVQGNISKDQAIKIMENVRTNLNCGRIKDVIITKSIFLLFRI